MPNWCENTVVIKGDVARLRELAEKYIGEQTRAENQIEGATTLLFEKVVPIPEGFDEHVSSPTPLDVNVLFPGLSKGPFAFSDEIPTYEWIPVEARVDRETCAAFIKTRAWPMTEADKENALADIRARAAAYQRNLELGGYATWYEWNIANWGTKWDASNVGETALEFDEGYIKLVFMTAWDAPRPIFNKLREEFDDLLFTIVADHEDGGPEIICNEAESDINISVDVNP